MKRLLKSHFLPPNYEQYLFSQFQHCTQDNKFVHQYHANFLRLLARNSIMETDAQLVSRFLDGLREPIQEKMDCQYVLNMSKAYNMASRLSGSYHQRILQGQEVQGDNMSQLVLQIMSIKGLSKRRVQVTVRTSTPWKNQKKRQGEATSIFHHHHL